MMEVRARHWSVAGVAALGLHAAVALWVLRTPPPPAVSLGGGGGVQVMLAPAAGPSAAEVPAGPRQDAAKATPDTVLSAAPPVAAPAKPEAEAAEAATPPETAKADAVETARPQAAPAVAPPPVPMPEIAATQAPEPEPEPEQQAARPPQPEAVTARDVTAPPVPLPRPEVPRRQIARAAPPPEPVQAAELPPPSGTVSAAAETQGRAASGSAGGQPAPDANAGAPFQSAASGGAADYMSRLRAWLEQHKEYPSRARRRRAEGTALLVFVMDRGGRVLSHRIERSAGDPSLDHAVAEMIQRAQPLPPIPDSFQQAWLEVRVPVQFLLR